MIRGAINSNQLIYKIVESKKLTNNLGKENKHANN